MSALVWWAVGVLVALLILFALYVGGAACLQLGKLQNAVMKHRHSARTRDDDAELYRAAGFPEWPDPPQAFMRGDQIR